MRGARWSPHKFTGSRWTGLFSVFIRYTLVTASSSTRNGAPMPKTTSSFNPDEYTTVAERIALFHQAYPNGQIHTRLVSYQEGRVIVEASVFRCAADARPATTGLASEHEKDGEINAVACLENTETSAIGRALANLGFTGSLRRPSREEMEKAHRAREALGRAAGSPSETGARMPADPYRLMDRVGRVAERSASAYERLQHRADVHVEVAKLLGRARRAGFPAPRADVLEAELEAARGEELRLAPIAGELRRWLRGYTGGLAETVAHPRAGESASSLPLREDPPHPVS